MSHAGDAQASLVETCLARHPSKMNLPSLRSRLVSTVGGDGAVAGGGPARRHATTHAAQKFWQKVYPDSTNVPELIEWDQFHRLHIAFMRCVEETPPAQELLAVGKAMSQQFGVGDGRVILRGISEAMQETATKAADVSGARKVGALSETSSNLLKNYKAYTAALHLKVLRKREGQGAASQATLTTLSRRLAAMDFVAYLLLFEDIMRKRLRPFSKITQSSTEAAWASQRSYLELKSGLLMDISNVRLLRRLVFIGSLLQHYLPKTDLKRFWFAQLYSPLGKEYPSFVKNIYGMGVQHQFQDCSLQLLVELAPGTICLTPRCQCPFQKKREGPSRCRVGLRIAGRSRRLLVPEYVAHAFLTKEDCRKDVLAAQSDLLDVAPRLSAASFLSITALLPHPALIIHQAPCLTTRVTKMHLCFMISPDSTMRLSSHAPASSRSIYAGVVPLSEAFTTVFYVKALPTCAFQHGCSLEEYLKLCQFLAEEL